MASQTRRRHPQRLTLRRLAAGLLCLSVLGGCAKNPGSHPAHEARRLEADLGSVWEASCRILADRGYDIQQSDRASGTIETDWLTVNPDYSASVFLTQPEDRYSDCGRPGLGKSYRGKQARLTVSLIAVGPGHTEVLVRAAFRTERKSLL